MLLLGTKIKIKVWFIWKGCSSMLISRGHSKEVVPKFVNIQVLVKVPAFNYDENRAAAHLWKTKVCVYEKLYALQDSSWGGKQWQNSSFFGKMPLLTIWNIFQLCIDFSQLPCKHTAFILWSLTVSPVFSSSFQLSTVFLLMDWFPRVKLKNSEHLITLRPAHFLRGKEERRQKAHQGLCQLNPSSQGICFSFGIRLDVHTEQCCGAMGECPLNP